MRWVKYTMPVLPVGLALLSVSSAGSARTNAITLPLGRCVNMANALEAPHEGEWGRPIANDDFAIIAAAGFDSVRIPVRWSGHAPVTPPYTIDAAFLSRVTQVVDAALAARLNVLLDDHNYDALFANPDAERERLAGLWRQIAVALKGPAPRPALVRDRERTARPAHQRKSGRDPVAGPGRHPRKQPRPAGRDRRRRL